MFEGLIEEKTHRRRVNRRDVMALLAEGEGLRIEFKRHFSSPEKIAKEMIAFANTKGGTILFGVDDDGSVFGLHSEKSELSEIEHVSKFLCDPPVAIACDVIPWSGHKDIIAVTVLPSENRPHTLVEYDSSGKRVTDGPKTGFVRVKDKSMQASKEVMSVMRSRRSDAPPLRIAIGYNERALFKYLEEHERITVQEFADLVNISRRRASKILVDLVRAGTVFLHTVETAEYFSLAE
ncbi:MAG: ATP-binding protein [Bacteroidota bacterium]|nr:ATP-binding protein [Bacteroidota bacterium]MDP4230343.1 ATP-binding protein [Bacteroidota bacterium]MDP4235242.1 ATP-binding protein [Bacteroidota bacterium]